jgi:hypothetical protein
MASEATVNRVAIAVPVTDMATGVSLWEDLLGVAPTFVDGDRWAQFDTPSGRVCLAGADRSSDHTVAMLKVADGQLEPARSAFAEQGYIVEAIDEGAHERRCTVRDGNGSFAVLYEPIQKPQPEGR